MLSVFRILLYLLLPVLLELDPANLVTGNDSEAVRCDKESG